MSESIEVNARLTATDEASPVIRALLRNIRRLERLGSAMTPQPAIAASIARAGDRAMAAQRKLIGEQKRAAAAIAGAGEGVTAKAKDGLRESLAFQARMAKQRANEDRVVVGRDLQRRLAFQGRMASQRLKDERRAQADAMRSLRQRLTLDARMSAQHDREARQRDGARRRDEVAHRRHLAAQDSEDRTARRSLRSAGRGVADSGRSLGRTAAIGGVASVAGTAWGARRLLGAEIDTDAAERNAMAYAGLSQEAARQLREQWAGPLSVQLGQTTATLLTSYTDAIKAGIPKAGAAAFAALTAKASEAWSIDPKIVTDVLGKANTILTSDGSQFSTKRLHSVANAIQHLSAGMATTPERMISFMERGSGAAMLLGMSQEAGLAFGAASTSLGNQAHESGSLLDYIASRVVEMPSLSRQSGEDGASAKRMLSALGYGSAQAMENARRANPDAFVTDFIGRFQKIQNPRRREETIRWFAGREWLGEFSRMVTGYETVKEAQRLAKEAGNVDAIGKVWSIHQGKLGFVLQQMGVGLLNLANEVGMVLSPMVKTASAYFVKFAAQNARALRVNFWAAMQGLVEGFLGREGTFRDLMDSIVGPKGLVANPAAFFQFAKSFAAGLKSVATGFAAFIKAVGTFTGIDSSSAAGLGELIGKLLGLSLALAILAPVLGVLGALATGIVGLVGALAAVRSVGLLKALSGAGAAASGGSGAAIGAGIGAALRKAAMRFLPVAIASGGAWALAGGTARQPESERAGYSSRGRTMTTLELQGRLAGMVPKMQNAQAMAQALAIAPKSALTERRLTDLRAKLAEIDTGLAEIDRSGTATGTAKAILEQLRAMRESVADALGEPAPDVRAKSRPDNRSGPPGRFSREAREAERISGAEAARKVWAQQGGGRVMLNAIAEAEGTSGPGGYNTSLGYGRFLPGGREQNLTAKTLSEVYLLGLHMRKQPGNPNSSALGKYQITGSTMLDAARALGMDPMTTKFDAKTQDRMAEWIAQTQGLGAWEGFKTNPDALARAQAALNNAGRPAVPNPASAAAGIVGGQAGAVDAAASMLGANENGRGRSAVNAFMRGAGYNIDAARTAWCAAFVNSSLASVGIEGTGSMVANSFLNWGEKIDPRNVMKGDVLVEHRGKGVNQTGGHVGMATGQTRMGPNGQLQMEMISGNSGRSGDGAVRKTWHSANSLAVRRDVTSNVPQTAAAITGNVPASTQAPDRTGSAGGGLAGTTIHAPITINGAGSPEAVAEAVSRRLGETRNWNTHDVDHDT